MQPEPARQLARAEAVPESQEQTQAREPQPLLSSRRAESLFHSGSYSVPALPAEESSCIHSKQVLLQTQSLPQST
jgi:hypothetical protein